MKTIQNAPSEPRSSVDTEIQGHSENVKVTETALMISTMHKKALERVVVGDVSDIESTLRELKVSMDLNRNNNNNDHIIVILIL